MDHTGMEQQGPTRVSRPWVEWRAGRIDDPVVRLRYLKSVLAKEKPARRSLRLRAGVLSILLAVVTTSFVLVRAGVRMEARRGPVQAVPALVSSPDALPEVWQVDKTADSEIYSNGLRIDNRSAVSNRPRSFHAYYLDRPETAEEQERTDPVGILFHTTESQQAPFEPGHNRLLKKVGESTLDFVRRHHAYNFLIDRFGRVYRIVNETDAADHAGNSIWADADRLYVYLNDSFLGVSFEAKTQPGEEDELPISPAQVRTASMLTEMLRSRYRISARNCVTHAQVSVNPSNMRIGWHTDWAAGFPFEKLGLPNNYAQPPAALAIFGFEYDDTFSRLAGPRLMAGIQLAEERLRHGAAEHGQTIAEWRKSLQKLYREKHARFSHSSSAAIEGDE
jgi:hypothetical protein